MLAKRECSEMVSPFGYQDALSQDAISVVIVSLQMLRVGVRRVGNAPNQYVRFVLAVQVVASFSVSLLFL